MFDGSGGKFVLSVVAVPSSLRLKCGEREKKIQKGTGEKEWTYLHVRRVQNDAKSGVVMMSLLLPLFRHRTTNVPGV